jgi:hypothetical protein
VRVDRVLMLPGLAVGSCCTWLDRHRFEALLTEAPAGHSISQTLSNSTDCCWAQEMFECVACAPRSARPSCSNSPSVRRSSSTDHRAQRRRSGRVVLHHLYNGADVNLVFSRGTRPYEQTTRQHKRAGRRRARLGGRVDPQPAQRETTHRETPRLGRSREHRARLSRA